MEEVADWVRKELNFANLPTNQRLSVKNSIKLLINKAIDGAVLLLYKNREDLETSLSLLEGHSRKLWAEIEKLKKAQGMRLI